ncbi:MAG: diguanylate cyclase response regulator [Betaproteobacteria bacterium HGW-Betaproteobacteria-14]|nr:MAG: diguanylate cyclase response regulator [Betaproteobacteria bacterium HGW-Betaproteobacteria-14]
MSETAVPALPRVLIVDDSRMVRATIVKLIKGRFEVREEGDGEAGWQTLMVDSNIKVLISDLTMPKLDGYGLLKRVRGSNIARIREMPVIMISGDEDESARHHAKECGATDFITKGIGTAELLARLDALVRLATTRSELEAMAKQVMVDPESGLSSEEYLKQQGRQALALAQRHGSEISVIVVEIDRLDDLIGRFGRPVGDQLIKQFRAILSKRVRLEDTVSQTGQAQFTVVCPGIGLDDARAFANRLDQTIRNATISYRGERVDVNLKFGLANSRDDEWQTMTHLLQLAEGRAVEEEEAKLVEPADVEEDAKPPMPSLGVEDAMALLHAGNAEGVKSHLAALAVQLMPLLKLIENELKLGMNPEDAEAKLKRLVSS